jgi:hypothetical protein
LGNKWSRSNITNVRLISDLAANLIGSFFIPNPNNINHPRFETGTKTLHLQMIQIIIRNIATTIAEEVIYLFWNS